MGLARRSYIGFPSGSMEEVQKRVYGEKVTSRDTCRIFLLTVVEEEDRVPVHELIKVSLLSVSI